MKKENEKTEISEEMYGDIFTVLYSLVEGDLRLYGYPNATRIFLHNLVSAMPEIKSNKRFFVDLVYNVPFENEYGYLLDGVLDYIFSFMDESLLSDKEFILFFLDLLHLSCRDGDIDIIKAKDSQGIPELCFDIPHELLMDEEVFEMLLKKVNPVDFYCELLTDEEKQNDEIVSKVLCAYKEYYDFYEAQMDNYPEAPYLDPLFRQMQNFWIEAIEELGTFDVSRYDFQDIEALEFKGGIKGFFENYFSFLAQTGFLTSYKGVEPKTFREKNDLYLQYLIDSNLSELSNIGSEDELRIFKNPELLKMLEKYWYQICLFAAIGVKEYDMFYKLVNGCDIRDEGENCDNSNIQNYEDNYLVLPTGGDDEIPFQ